MKNYSIAGTPLFQGFTEKEAESVLDCLSAVERPYKKEETIFRIGDTVSSVGMVVNGSVQVIREDFWGNRQVIAGMESGQIFGESYACVQNEILTVSVIAARDSDILFLDMKRLLTVCSSACQFHSRLIQNLLAILAGRNLYLTAKIDHMGQRTIREKVLAYLSWQAEKQGAGSFEIPFNRQQLADYLAVDRSALSAELSKMQKDGLISYEKSRFVIH